MSGLVLGALLAAACAGCSTVGFNSDDVEVTGSIKPRQASLETPAGAPPKGVATGDWVQAKAALEAALASRENGASMPWENTATGARGSATPIGSARDNGCRDFIISVVDKAGDRWVQGEACREGSGIALSQVRILGRA